MHTFEGKTIRIHHNSDFGGNVFLVNKETNEEIEILSDDLIDFVSELVRGQKIREIEQMDSKEILGLK